MTKILPERMGDIGGGQSANEWSERVERVGRVELPAPAVPDLSTLYRDQRRALVGLAYLLIGDRAVAQDVVQDAFVALQRNAHAPRNELALPYLRRTVVNLSRSELRHRYVVKRFLQRHSDAPGVGPRLVAEDDAAIVQALRRLPRRQREILVLRYWADLPHADIAALLGLPVGSVKSAVSRGLASRRQTTEDQA